MQRKRLQMKVSNVYTLQEDLVSKQTNKQTNKQTDTL